MGKPRAEGKRFLAIKNHSFSSKQRHGGKEYAAVLLLLYGVVLRLLGMTADLLDATTALNAMLLVMGNVVFLLTDVVLQRMTVLWHNKLRKKILPR